MLNVVIELCLGFLQYFAFITETPDVDFPEAWKNPMYYFSVVNLNFDFMSDIFPVMGDLRIYFMLISVIGPLIFVFFGLFFLFKKRVVLWYFFMVFGIMMMFAGAFGRIISETTDLNITNQDAESLLYAGLITCGLCVILYILNKKGFCGSDDEVEVTQRKKVIEQETKRINVSSTLLVTLLCALLFLFAILALRLLTPILADEMDKVAPDFSFGMGIAALVLFVVFLIWLIMGLSVGGRTAQWKIGNWFESGFLKVLLVSMSLAYIPIGSGVFFVFNCNDFSCPTGSRLPDKGSSVWVNTSVAGKNCAECRVAFPNRCPVSVISTMCASATSERLEYDVAQSCDGMRTFFWPAALLVVIMYVLGVPIMFQHLIKVCSEILFEDFPVRVEENRHEGEHHVPEQLGQNQVQVEPEELSEDKLWLLKISQSSNVARFLFQPFEYKYRYVRLFQVIQKLMIVGTSVYIIRNSAVSPQAISLGCSLAIHLVATVVLVYHRPFISDFEDKIAVIMSAALSLSCIMAILLLNAVDVPLWVLIIIIVCNGLLPLIALIIGVVLEWSSSKESEEEQKKEEERRMNEELSRQEILDQENAELEAAIAASMATAENDGSGAHTKQAQKASEIKKAELRKREEKLRKKMEIERRVHDKMEKDLEILKEKQADVDLRVDRTIKSRLQKFLMGGGVFGFLALGLCILGLMVRDQNTVLEPFPEFSTIETEFVGFTTWHNFTTHCCCSGVTNPSSESSFLAIERWVCDTGDVKERVRSRVQGSTVIDGMAIRGLCSMDFVPTCAASVSNGGVTIICSSSHSVEELRLW